MLTQEELDSYRGQLQELIGRLSGDVTSLEGQVAHGLGGESGGGLSNLPIHLADLGSASHQSSVGLALLAREEGMLDECNAALARLEGGTFGRCEGCQRAIARKRLRSVPFARHCIDCARKRETAAG